MALGGEMVPGGIAFFGDRTDAERADGAASIINAMSAEASIMARCTGKTDVRNIEPEDLRAITLASARAFGIPLAGAEARHGDRSGGMRPLPGRPDDAGYPVLSPRRMLG